MLTILLLLLTATLGAQTVPPPPSGSRQPVSAPAPVVPTLEDAAGLAETGELKEALRAFQQIASANPDDHAARLRIADLHMQMGHPARAESVYRSVLLENPTDLRAMLGVGLASIARHEYKDAIKVLEAAEKAAPEDSEMLPPLAWPMRSLARPRDPFRIFSAQR